MAYLNRISPVVPSNDVHQAFIGFARGLLAGQRTAPLFDRLVSRSQIDHRWSVLGYGDGHSEIGAADFYRLGDFPTTGERMAASGSEGTGSSEERR